MGNEYECKYCGSKGNNNCNCVRAKEEQFEEELQEFGFEEGFKLPVYWGIDQEKVIFDSEGMLKEFEHKLKEMEELIKNFNERKK